MDAPKDYWIPPEPTPTHEPSDYAWGFVIGLGVGIPAGIVLALSFVWLS